MKGPMYFLPCAVCGCRVTLSRQRIQELAKANTLPVCRRNGCYRIVGRPSVGRARVRRVCNRPIMGEAE